MVSQVLLGDWPPRDVLCHQLTVSLWQTRFIRIYDVSVGNTIAMMPCSVGTMSALEYPAPSPPSLGRSCTGGQMSIRFLATRNLGKADKRYPFLPAPRIAPADWMHPIKVPTRQGSSRTVSSILNGTARALPCASRQYRHCMYALWPGLGIRAC